MRSLLALPLETQFWLWVELLQLLLQRKMESDIVSSWFLVQVVILNRSEGIPSLCVGPYLFDW